MINIADDVFSYALLQKLFCFALLQLGFPKETMRSYHEITNNVIKLPSEAEKQVKKSYQEITASAV